MTDWVKFHLEICRGAKKGIPRAERFVYMELSREARANGGFIVLPLEMSDLDAVCEVLGGNREEVVAAVKRFSKGPDPSLVFEGPKHRRLLRVVRWGSWNALPEPSGASTPRVQKFRDAKKSKKNGVSTGNDGNGIETPVSSNCNTSQRQSQRQSQKRSRAERDPDPEDQVYLPPLSVKPGSPAETHLGNSGVGGGEDVVVQIYDHYLVGWKSNKPRGRPPSLTPFRRKLIEERLGEGASAEDLMEACDGIWRSQWHVEKGFTLVEHVMRDREHVDRFMHQRAPTKTVQSSDGYTEDDEREAQARFKALAEQKRQERIAATGRDPMA